MGKMEKINDDWLFSPIQISGKQSGDIEEFETLLTFKGVDDSIIMLRADTVQEMFNSFKIAYDNKKPFRFNLKLNKKSSIKRTITKGTLEQLQIRFMGDYVENFDVNKINNSKDNYFELYYGWDKLPNKIKDSIINPK